jgi:hypothetical protein
MATKDLDFGNVIKQVYDPPTESLKVLATISIGSISVDLDASTDSIRLGDGVLLNTLTPVGPKNALDVYIAGGSLALTIDHTDDSIRLGDGTILFTGTTVGLKSGLDVNLINTVLPLASNAATESKQDSQITILNSIDGKLTSPISITALSLPLPTGAATEAKQDSQITELQVANSTLTSMESLLTSLDTKFINPLPVSITGSVSVAEPLIISGTEDGTPSGIERTFVNNRKLQVLASKDRTETYTYADFGTKNQRITRVDYTSATFSGSIIRRDFNYVLDGNKYKRTNSIWSIV